MLGTWFEIVDMSVLPAVAPADETGSTFEENACIKAWHAAAHFAGPVLADDSGLEVDALGGAPGVYSARYAGPHATDADNRTKLLAELKDMPAPRTARFRCVIAWLNPGAPVRCFSGALEGTIVAREAGTGGFGYDPVFFPENSDRTLAEMSAGEKNRLSHRAAALAALARDQGFRPVAAW